MGIKVAKLDAVNNFTDIDGLAALIACDYVVSIDNTVHLAGVGRPDEFTAAFNRDWRWGHEHPEAGMIQFAHINNRKWVHGPLLAN